MAGFNRQQLAELISDGIQSGASGTNQYLQGKQEQNLAKLKQNLGSETTTSNLKILNNYLKSGKLPPGAGLTLGANGEVATSRGFNPMASQLALEKLLLSQQNLNNKNVEGISDRAQKEGIPEIQAQIDILNQNMQNNGGHLESVGGLKNAIPDSLVPMAEYFGILPKGSAKERQDIAALRNAAQHATFGSRQTEAEKAMMGQQLGTSIGNSAANVEAGIRGLGDVSNREASNLISGSTPQAAQTFRQRGGNLQVGPLGGAQQPPQAPAPNGMAALPQQQGTFDPDAFLKSR